jgi:hypothetical protein
VAGRRQRRERLQRRKRCETAAYAQQGAPVKPACQKVAAAGAASDIVQLVHLSPRLSNRIRTFGILAL